MGSFFLDARGKTLHLLHISVFRLAWRGKLVYNTL